MKWLQGLLKDPVDGSVPSLAEAGSAPDPADQNERAVAPAESNALTPSFRPPTGDVPFLEEPATPTSEPPATETATPATPLTEREPVCVDLSELSGGQLQILSAQQELAELFRSRIRSDEVQARALEALHDELKQYKAGFVRQQMLPLLKEIIFCHDFVTRELDRLKSAGEAATDGAVRALDVLRQMLLDLLFKFDVEPYRVEGDQFDPKSQQCAKTQPAESAEQDKRIASRGLEGFRTPEGIVRREQVTVCKFTPGAN